MKDETRSMNLCTVPLQEIERAFDVGEITMAVIGTGHIGLMLACHFAQANANVLGVDVDPTLVDKINRGESPFSEVQPVELVKNSVDIGRLRATTDLSEALDKANVVIISVPTPFKRVRDKYEPDLTCVLKVSGDVGRRLRRGCAVIVASTVYIGATRGVILPLLERHSGLRAGRDFLLANVPQRIDPGNRVHRLDNTPLNVGGFDKKSADVAAALFGRIVDAEIRRVSSLEVAESTKLVENTYRDVNIALANELAVFFRRFGIDTAEVMDACSTKWSFQPHSPGPGVGGPCIPTSPRYLLRNAASSELRMVRLARKINDGMPDRVVDLIVRGLEELTGAESLRGRKVAILGLTYKRDVGDTRGSPAERVIRRLKQLSFNVAVHDPLVPTSASRFGCSNLTLNEVAEGADCLVLLTDHTAFRNDVKRVERLVRDPCLLVDTKQVFRPSDFKGSRFVYWRI